MKEEVYDVAQTDVGPRAETHKPEHKYRNVFHEPQSGKETRLKYFKVNI